MLVIEKIANDLVEKGFSFIEQIFEEEFLKLLHNEIMEVNRNSNFKEAGVGRLENHILAKDIRRDKIKWIEGETFVQKVLLNKLEYIRRKINENLMMGLFDVEAHYAIYKKGDFYKRHFDNFQGKKNRLISLVIYLNKEWQEKDGGILNLYHNKNDDNPLFSIVPNWGSAILFLSEKIPHEVTLSNKTRYSITAWFRIHNFFNYMTYSLLPCIVIKSKILTVVNFYLSKVA